MNWKIDTNTPLNRGDMVTCSHCSEKHPVKYGIINGRESNDLLYIVCPKNGSTILVGLDGYKIEKNTKDPPVIKISDLISKLEELKNQHGDIPIKYAYDGPDASCYLNVKDITIGTEQDSKQYFVAIW